MRKRMTLTSIVIMAFFIVGCASIVGKSVFPVSFISNPEGANITIKDENGLNVFSGVTPTIVSLTAGESYFHAKKYKIIYSKAGYPDQISELNAGISGWYFGNILFGGLIGLLIVDPITGKMWKLPKDMTVNFSEKMSANSKEKQLQIVSLNQIPQEMRKNLIKVN